MSDIVCPFCGSNHKNITPVYISSREYYYEIICDLYGAVAITNKAMEIIEEDDNKKKRLLHLLVEKMFKDYIEIDYKNVRYDTEKKESLLQEKIVLITGGSDDISSHSRYQVKTLDHFLRNYPVKLTEKLSRSLCNLARMHSCYSFELLGVRENEIFAKTPEEAKYYCGLLVDAGWCKRGIPGSREEARNSSAMSLTIDGWKKFEELEKTWQNSNTAFIAMWFHDITKQYRKAVEVALDATGYEPIIIDTYEHNNFIMDEVINKINEARFVIADFTCLPEQPEKDGKIPGGVRGGVYFEAGYARGLGKEVIVTCSDSDDAKKRRHFDIDQINTLFWHEVGDKLYCGDMDFTKRLTERIKATVGRGNLL